MVQLGIETDQLHLWLCAADDIADQTVSAGYDRLLDDAESARLGRFKFERHRRQYLVTRALLKTTLSFYHPHVAPRDWRFTLNRHGKPSISNQTVNDPVMFNLAHSGGMIVLAVARDGDVGVDIEPRDRQADVEAISARYFSAPELDALLNLSGTERQRYFIRLWTLKEAFVKARGLGLSMPLNRFGFTLSDDRTISFKPDPAVTAEKWHFWQFDHAGEFNVAVALHHPDNAAGIDLIARKVVPAVTHADLDIDDIRCSRRPPA